MHYTRSKISDLVERLKQIERENRESKEFVAAKNKVLRNNIATNQAKMMATLSYLLKEKIATKKGLL